MDWDYDTTGSRLHHGMKAGFDGSATDFHSGS